MTEKLVCRAAGIFGDVCPNKSSKKVTLENCACYQQAALESKSGKKEKMKLVRCDGCPFLGEIDVEFYE